MPEKPANFDEVDFGGTMPQTLEKLYGDNVVLKNKAKQLFTEAIADAVQKVLSDEVFRGGIIEKGKKNVEKFSWERCSRGIIGLLRKEK